MASGLPLKYVANFLLPGADRYNLRQPEYKFHCQTRTAKAVQPVNEEIGTARALPVFRRKTCAEEIADAFDLSGPQLTRQQFIAAFTDPGTTENMVHADPVKEFSSRLASRFFSCIGNSNSKKLDTFTSQFMAPSTKVTCGRPLVGMRYELIKQLTTQLSSEVELVSKVVDERIRHMVKQLDADIEELKMRERVTQDRNQEFGPLEIVLPQVFCAHAHTLDVREGRHVVITSISAELSMKPSLALDPYGGYDCSIEEIDWMSRSRVCSISYGAGTVMYH